MLYDTFIFNNLVLAKFEPTFLFTVITCLILCLAIINSAYTVLGIKSRLFFTIKILILIPFTIFIFYIINKLYIETCITVDLNGFFIMRKLSQIDLLNRTSVIVLEIPHPGMWDLMIYNLEFCMVYLVASIAVYVRIIEEAPDPETLVNSVKKITFILGTGLCALLGLIYEFDRRHGINFFNDSKARLYKTTSLLDIKKNVNKIEGDVLADIAYYLINKIDDIENNTLKEMIYYFINNLTQISETLLFTILLISSTAILISFISNDFLNNINNKLLEILVYSDIVILLFLNIFIFISNLNYFFFFNIIKNWQETYLLCLIYPIVVLIISNLTTIAAFLIVKIIIVLYLAKYNNKILIILFRTLLCTNIIIIVLLLYLSFQI